jgi:hypothetical protein
MNAVWKSLDGGGQFVEGRRISVFPGPVEDDQSFSAPIVNP